MSVSSHRKLNSEQLINLAQLYWDDPTKLMEIIDATEGRVDQAAQLLFSAATNRLERLRRDPAHALAEETPHLAELIAARLGKVPPDKASGDAAAAADIDEEAEDRKPRRRWPLVLVALLALLAVGAWFLWPKAKEEVKTAAIGTPGIEILEQGQRVEEEAKRGGAQSGLSGRRQAEFPTHEDHARDVAARDLAGRALTAQTPAQPRVSEAEELQETPGARTRTSGTPSGTGARAAAERATQQGGGAAPGTRATSPAASRTPPSPGVAIADAQLECFLSDSSPTACGAPPAGARGAGAGGGGGGGAAPSPAAANRAASSPPANATAASSSPQSPSSPPNARGESASAGGGSGGGNRSGGGGAPSDTPASSPAASSAVRPPAQSAAGGGAASPPPQQRPPAQQPNQPDAPVPPDPDCPTEAQPGRVVFIFDGSVSMGLPLGLDPAEEDRLDEGTRRRDPETRAEYRALLQQPGPKRMGRAQLAFSEATEDLPDHVELGLVVFQECRDIRQVGLFGAGRRGPAIDYVRAMIPRGRTPLAQSLMVAQEMLDSAKGSIVLLTDGREFCSGDPCAVAEHLKATRPGTPVHIVDITGQASAECVAEITGGRSYAPSETEDLSRVLRAAFRGAAAHCPDTR